MHNIRKIKGERIKVRKVIFSLFSTNDDVGDRVDDVLIGCVGLEDLEGLMRNISSLMLSISFSFSFVLFLFHRFHLVYSVVIQKMVQDPCYMQKCPEVLNQRGDPGNDKLSQI